MKIIVPDRSHRAECVRLFHRAIAHAALGDGFDPEQTVWVREESERASGLFAEHCDTGSGRRRFLAVEIDGKIVGTIGTAPPSSLLGELLPDLVDDTPEIICAFVDPDHHRHGVGCLLYSAISEDLRNNGTNRWVLDCGYRSSQGFWRRLLGEPTVTMKGYWGEGYDHLVWVCTPSSDNSVG